MKQINFRKLLPHLVAVVIFLILSIVLTKPALEGRVVQQHDVIQWKAMAQESKEFLAKNGYYPRWTNSMFAGMPAFTIALSAKNPNHIHIGYVAEIMTLGLPKPVYYLFIAALCFYILSLAVGVNPWISIMGGIAYAYCSYDPVLILAGHDTKLMSMAFAPAVLAGLQLMFKQRYWLGAALVLIFGIQMMGQNHQQIVYYTLLMALIMAIPFIYKCIKQKQVKHLLITGAFCLFTSALMLANQAITYWPAVELSKETMRGGRSELTDSSKEKKNETKGGLNKDYAFMWSYGKAETLTMMVPNAFGGSSAEPLPEDGKAMQALQEAASTMPNGNGLVQQVAQSTSMYWGELLNTSGTVYMGAFICLLFLLGAFLSKSEHKWWLIAVTVFGIILAWGKNFEAVNYFLFDYMPLYKKFRAPSMALVMPQLSIALLACIFLNEFTAIADKEKLKVLFKKCLYVTGATAVVLIGFYFMADFTNGATGELKKNIDNALQGQGGDFTRSYFAGLKADRQSLFRSDLLRSFFFIAVGIAALFLYARKLIKPTVLYTMLILFTAIDLMGVAKRYIRDEIFVEPTDYETVFAEHQADIDIKKDKGFFRVLPLAFPAGNGQFNISVGEAFENALPSFHHHNIGGYHAAKLGLFQDLRERQLYKNIQAWGASPATRDSFPVLNMLNMKYVIVPATGNPTQTQAILNPYAMGNCWLVKEVKFVKNADAEMKALDAFDPAQTAFVDERYKTVVPTMPVYDSAAYIKLIENKNDEISYDFNAATNQFAVFSEIYYPHGWKVTIDGKPADYCRTNYLLRGLPVPAGKHKIEFKFEPPSVIKGEAITNYANTISVLFVLLCIFMIWRSSKKQTAAADAGK